MARVLYFSRDYTPHDHRFLSALARTDHEVFYLRLERGPRALEDRPLPPEVTLVRWAGGRGPVRGRDGWRLLRDLRRVIREVQPDLIHAGPVQRSAFLAALSGFRPLVSMTWGYDLLFDAERNAAWRWATRFTLRRSDLLIADCATLRDRAVAYGMPAERVVYFPWGIDLVHFSPGADGGLRARKGWDAETFVVLSNRAWEPIYGVDVVARAFVQAARQEPRLRLLLLGGGSQAAQLRRILLQGGVSDRVEFVGYVSQRDLPRYYRAANLYVSASHSDGSSISLLEALACGVPAAVSDIPGNREWITPGETGWWFPDGDADALAEVILEAAAADRARRKTMGQAARALAEDRADWRKNFQQLLHAYDRVLGG